MLLYVENYSSLYIERDNRYEHPLTNKFVIVIVISKQLKLYLMTDNEYNEN